MPNNDPNAHLMETLMPLANAVRRGYLLKLVVRAVCFLAFNRISRGGYSLLDTKTYTNTAIILFLLTTNRFV